MYIFKQRSMMKVRILYPHSSMSLVPEPHAPGTCGFYVAKQIRQQTRKKERFALGPRRLSCEGEPG